MRSLGPRLRDLRKRAGLSLYDVERQLRHQGAEVHFTSISKYERGERQPSLAVLRELARAYNVSLAQVVTGASDLDGHLPPDLVEALSLLEGRPDLIELLQVATGLTGSQARALASFIRTLPPGGGS